MHNAIILITSADSKEEALKKVNTFMADYGDGKVWDWFAIGGRWSGILAPDRTEYEKWAHDFIKSKLLANPKWDYFVNEEKEFDSYPQSIVEDNAKEFEKKWKELGYSGPSPYFNNYNLPKTGGAYDIVPVSECLHVLPEWITDVEKEKNETWDKMVEARNEYLTTGKYDMSGYYSGKYYSLSYGEFSWEFGSFDIDEQEPLKETPTELENKWAIVVDMHN